MRKERYAAKKPAPQKGQNQLDWNKNLKVKRTEQKSERPQPRSSLYQGAKQTRNT